MTRAQLARVERSAFRQFVEAVLAFSDDPGPANLERGRAAGSMTFAYTLRWGSVPGTARNNDRGAAAAAPRFRPRGRAVHSLMRREGCPLLGGRSRLDPALKDSDLLV
jgi:hypothetical protein